MIMRSRRSWFIYASLLHLLKPGPNKTNYINMMSAIISCTNRDLVEWCVTQQLFFLAWSLVFQVIFHQIKLAKLLKMREAPSQVLSYPLLIRSGFSPKTVPLVYKGHLDFRALPSQPATKWWHQNATKHFIPSQVEKGTRQCYSLRHCCSNFLHRLNTKQTGQAHDNGQKLNKKNMPRPENSVTLVTLHKHQITSVFYIFLQCKQRH